MTEGPILFGMNMNDMLFLGEWSGQHFDICAAVVGAFGSHAGNRYRENMVRALRLKTKWEELGGTFPITEKDKVFAPAFPVVSVPGRVPSIKAAA